MEKIYDLNNLPEEFKILFSNVTKQIREFGDTIILAEFSFLSINIIYSCNFGDKVKNSNAELCRDLIYDVINDKEYVDKKINQLEIVQGFFCKFDQVHPQKK